MIVEDYGLCTEENNDTQDYKEGNPRWVVKLDDNTSVYCFDGKGKFNDADWVRLKQYCEDTGHFITEMYIHFRSNSVSLPPNKEGYFFRRSAIGSFGSDYTEEFMLIGYIENNQVIVLKYKVPEILYQYTENREIDDCGDSLIKKNV